MAKVHGKKYNQAASLIEAERLYSLDEAVELLERTNTVKFDPTIEIHFNLSIHVKRINSYVLLSHFLMELVKQNELLPSLISVTKQNSRLWV